MDCSLPSSSVHGIFQARVLEWVAISFYRESSHPRGRTQVSRIVQLWMLFNRIWACQPTTLSHGHRNGEVTVPHRSVKKNEREWKELFKMFIKELT